MSRMLSFVLILATLATPSQAAPKWLKSHRVQIVAVAAAIAVAVVCADGKGRMIATAPYSKLRVGVFE